jgi:hypothetical protein
MGLSNLFPILPLLVKLYSFDKKKINGTNLLRFSSSPTASALISRSSSARATGAAPDLHGSEGAGAVKKVLTHSVKLFSHSYKTSGFDKSSINTYTVNV